MDLLAVGLLLFFAVEQRGFAFDSAAHRTHLLEQAFQNPAATSPKAARLGYIPTNTLAFREYTLNRMVTQANYVNENWQLGLPVPITTDHLSRMATTPKVDGFAGGITISNRYHFQFDRGQLSGFHNSDYWWQGVERDSSRLAEMAKQRSLLTTNEAGQIAERALRGLGITPHEFDLQDMPFIEQYHHLAKDDRKLPLPLFLVSWRPSPSARFDNIRMEVSGLTKKVVCYENPLVRPRPLPTNYFDMLGISPDRGTWGKQFGYDPRHTSAFEQSTRLFAVAQANRLLSAWKLDFSRALTTNDIKWFLAEPKTNAPAISATFTNRFYLQLPDGYVGLFEDMTHSRSSFGADELKLRETSVMTNRLDEKTAIQLARDSLHMLGLDEKKLRLREPPSVTQVEFPGSASEEVIKLPLYDVFWSFLPDEQVRFGDMAAVGVQISAVTKRLTMFANNCPWTPKLPMPTNQVAW